MRKAGFQRCPSQRVSSTPSPVPSLPGVPAAQTSRAAGRVYPVQDGRAGAGRAEQDAQPVAVRRQASAFDWPGRVGTVANHPHVVAGYRNITQLRVRLDAGQSVPPSTRGLPHRPTTRLLAGTITSPREESPPESPPIAYTLPGPAAPTLEPATARLNPSDRREAHPSPYRPIEMQRQRHGSLVETAGSPT